jgi:putative membrane protein
MKSVKGLEPAIHTTEPELKVGDVLALDRSQLAAERTLMAWVRTALSMISFGFTIYKFLQFLQEEGRLSIMRPQAPRNVGLTLIGIGTFALAVACIQHRRYVAQLIRLAPVRPRKALDLSLIVAFLLLLLGVLMFGSIVLRSGPFS